jgi:hypothetical protein
MNDYDLLIIKKDPDGFLGVEWRGLFIYHGQHKQCEAFCLTFTEKLNQVKMERSGFDRLQAGDYVVRKREVQSYAAWRIFNGKIALDGTPICAQVQPFVGGMDWQSVHEKLNDLEKKAREERLKEEAEERRKDKEAADATS